MDMLGKNDLKDSNTRDSFGRERELQAGRDAAGYGHVPLGAFHWGMLDNQHGDGIHEDRTGLRVLDPTPHDSIDWPKKEQVLQSSAWGKQAPDWWKTTQSARDQVGEQWNETIHSPKTQVPFQAVASVFKTAAVLRSPWFEHPQSGEKLTGQPGQSLMSHIVEQTHLSTPEIWAQVANAGKS
jgi:hypothetical protein